MKKYNLNEGESFLGLISKQDRVSALEQSTLKKFKKGEQIVRELDTDTNLYLINSGKVRVTLFSNRGKEVSFVDIEKGGNFGEFSAIDGKPRSANVIALSDAEITILPPEVFLWILENYPVVCIEILKQITGIVRRLCNRIFEYSTLDVRNRIALELLRRSEGEIDGDGVRRIENPPTQLELASRLSCSREVVSREFKSFEALGVISRSTKILVIEDYNRLQAIAEGTET